MRLCATVAAGRSANLLSPPSPLSPLSLFPLTQTQCPSGVGCVFSSYVFCDGKKDCADGSDEDPLLCNESFNCSATSRVRQ